jgi:hypothetical protein
MDKHNIDTYVPQIIEQAGVYSHYLRTGRFSADDARRMMSQPQRHNLSSLRISALSMALHIFEENGSIVIEPSAY